MTIHDYIRVYVYVCVTMIYVCVYTRSCDWRSEILFEIQLYLSSICLIKKKEQDMRGAAAGAAKNITHTHTNRERENHDNANDTRGNPVTHFGAAVAVAVATHPAALA